MSFNKYYQDELAFLREMGREYAKAYPASAQFLADRGSDPDVERLLEGFAFLTGRIRQKLDDEFPELTQAMMELLWPHYLRTIPSMSIVEFTPIAGSIREKQNIAGGTEIASVPVEGTPCRFRTCFDVAMYPFTISKAELEVLPEGRTALRINFIMSQGTMLSQAHVDSIRFHLNGESAFPLYLWLCRYTAEIRFIPVSKGKTGQELSLPSAKINPVGFKKEESLIPYPKTSFDGYRLLQEYFIFPDKFMFVELTGIERFVNTASCESFEISFIFSRPPPPSLRVSKENIRLYCTPVVNIFPMESEPLRIDHHRVEYRIMPAGNNPVHYEIYSVDSAAGWIRGTAEEKKYEPFYSFKQGLGTSGRNTTYYQKHLKNAVVSEGTDTYITFVNIEMNSIVPPTETVVFQLTCTNRNLAGKLRVGDIQTPTESSPEFARFNNITKVTPAIRPPLGGDLYWRLISHLSLNHLSISNLEAFRGILELYNFQAAYDRQLGRANERRINGVKEINALAEDMLFQGMPVRGTSIYFALLEDHFAGEGDMFLFASIINEFLSLYATINSFSRLTVRGVQEGEVYQWMPRAGQQTIM